MSSARFIENLTDLANKNVPDRVRAFLRNNGEELERLAQKAVDSKGMLSPEEARSFTKIYSEYATKAKMDRSRGLSADALNAEIRNDFFNGVLGHIARNNVEREALLMAITRRFTGNEADASVKLLSGKTILKSDYDAMRTVPQSSRKGLTSDEQVLWDIVQANETALRQNAKSMATSNDRAISTAADRARREARAAQETAERQAETARRQAGAQPGNIAGLTIDEMARISDHVKGNPNFDTNMARIAFPDNADFAIWQKYRNAVTKENMGSAIPDTIRKLSKSIGNTDRLDVDDVFSKLAGWMRDPSQNQLVKTLADTGRQTELGSYKSIAEAIQKGEKVSEDEFFALSKFFGANLDVVAQKPVAAPGMNNFALGATGNPLNTIMTGVSKVADMMASSASVKPKPVSRGLISEWESPDRVRPSIFSFQGLSNRLLDNPRTSTAIGATLLVGGNFLTTLYDPKEASTLSAGIFQIIYPGSWFTNDKVLEKEDDITIRQVIQYRSGAGVSEQFVTDTKKFTGVDIFAAKDGRTATSLDPEKLFEISTALREKGTSGFNPRDFKAYLFALYGFSNAPIPEGTDGKAADTSDMIAKLVGYNEQAVIGGIVRNLLVGEGTNNKFIEMAKKFSGITIPSDPTTGSASSSIPPSVLLEIATGLQKSATKGNDREVTAFALALQKKISPLTDVSVKPSDAPAVAKDIKNILSDTVNMAIEHYVQTLSNSKDETAAFYQKILGKDFASPIAQNIAILTKLQDRNFLETREGKVMLALAYNGLLKKEAGHSPAVLQAEINTLTSTIGQTEAAERDLAAQRALDRGGEPQQPRQQQSAPPAATPSRNRASISATFNNFSDGLVYEDLNGKSLFLQNAYDVAITKPRPADEFVAQLKKDTQIKPETIQFLRQLAFGN